METVIKRYLSSLVTLWTSAKKTLEINTTAGEIRASISCPDNSFVARPRVEKSTSSIWASREKAKLMGIAKLTPSETVRPPCWAIHLDWTIPTTSPRLLTKGPPLFPGLTAASNWKSFCFSVIWIAVTCPLVVLRVVPICCVNGNPKTQTLCSF